MIPELVDEFKCTYRSQRCKRCWSCFAGLLETDPEEQFSKCSARGQLSEVRLAFLERFQLHAIESFEFVDS